MSALDRETKLAITLGLERRQKAAVTLADVLEQHEDSAPTKANAWPVAMQREPEPEHAERHLGELMQAQRETLGLVNGRPKKNGSDSDPFSKPTLAEAGIDKHLADRARKNRAARGRARSL